MKSKEIKRDRVIFISLIDILLQFIFVLLIVVLFVYRDYDSMVIKLTNSSKCEADKDSCKKDLQRCENQSNQCNTKLENYLKDNLQACMAISKTNTAKSINFSQKSTNEVIFENFTESYLRYLSETNQKNKIETAKLIKEGTVIKLDNIEKLFGFVREQYCYHDFYLRPIATLNSVESSIVYGRISSVLKNLQ